MITQDMLTPPDTYDGLHEIARAILPVTVGGTDASGTFVTSLTEAIMGMTAAMMRIAEAIESHNE